MITTNFLNPMYVKNADLPPKIKSFANDVLYKVWRNFKDVSPLFAKLYPWGEQRTEEIIQVCFDMRFKHDWVSFLKLAKFISDTSGHDACSTELFFAAVHEWARKDYTTLDTICIYSSINRDYMIVGKKTKDPNYLCKMSMLPLNSPLFEEDRFCKAAIIKSNIKFNKEMLQNIDYYE